MQKLRALSFALLVCFISCILCVPASASGLLIDDLPIDPVGDLEYVENYEPPEPTDPVFSDPYESQPIEQPNENAFLSLDDNNPVRYITWSEGINYGWAGGYGASVPADNGEFSIENSDVTFYQSLSNTGVTGKLGLQILAGTTIEYFANVNYSPDEFASFELSGVGKVYIYGQKGSAITLPFYPDTIQLLVNGNPVGGEIPVSETDGTFSFPLFTYEITEQITSIGYLISYNLTHQGTSTQSVYGTLININLYLEDSGVFTFTQANNEPEYKGFLETIIGWLDNIWNGIKNIANSILEGLKSLFVPNQEDIEEIKDMYSALLEERLGFVYEAFVMLDDSFTDIKNAFTNGNKYSFTFPGISFPMNGEIVTIVEEQEINMENKFMDTVRPVFGTIACLFATAGVIRTGSDMVVAIVSGVSPFAFYQAKKEKEASGE